MKKSTCYLEYWNKFIDYLRAVCQFGVHQTLSNTIISCCGNCLERLCVLLLIVSGVLLITIDHQSKSLNTIAAQSFPANQSSVYKVYLPVVTKPFTVTGEIELTGTRTKGITSFIPLAELDFSGLDFSVQPVDMRIWLANSDEEDSAWVKYETPHGIELDSKIYGAQFVNVRFRAANGASSPLKQLVLFYIPNGDFNDEILDGWNLIDEGLSFSLISDENPRLRLGSADYKCDNGVPLGAAIAEITLALLNDGSFYLNVEGTIYSEDQNPSNNDLYDAFEIFVNNNLVKRLSNQEVPVNCIIPVRQIPFTESITLATYDQSISISLQNHNRFDQYFNTYTDIRTIWIDKLP